MIDTRTVGQELQDQVLAAARKGQQRVNSTVKTITATAALIRPQLPSLPRPTLPKATLPKPNLSGLPRPTLPGFPTPAQIREKAPALAAMLPSPQQLRTSAEQLRTGAEQLRTGAFDLAGQVLSMQRKMADQIRSATVPLAKQAASAFAQVTSGAKMTQPSEISEDAKTAHNGAAHNGDGDKASSAPSRTTTPKPRTKSAAKASGKPATK
jgi:hypothetical protein